MYLPLPPSPPLNPLPHLVEVLDTAVRADLESLRFSYFVKLLVCTELVLLGLALEIGEILDDVVGFFWRRKIDWEYEATPALIREKREPSHKIKMFAALGWLLIVIGVGGEGYFEGFVSWADSTLQTFSNILLEAAHREAGDAAKSAKIARNEADAASKVASDAFDKSKAAEDAAGKAQEKAGKAVTSASDALALATKAQNEVAATEEELADEHNKRMKLEKDLAPRFIWRVQKGNETNFDVLKPFAEMSVRVECIQDREAKRAAESLTGFFVDAGWNVDGKMVWVVPNDLPDGVLIQTAPPEHDTLAEIDESIRMRRIASEVISWLHANDWEADWGQAAAGELKPRELRVQVGFKPSTYFRPLKEVFPKPTDERAEQIRKQIKELMKSDPTKNLIISPP